MESYIIRGGSKLEGVVDVSGAKNAVLPILAASVMVKGECVFHRCPEITDVSDMLTILRALGIYAEKKKSIITVNSSCLSEYIIPDDLMKKMRSGIVLAGPLLARCGEAVVGNPGGCNIGKRPVDIHINGFKMLGADITREGDFLRIKAGNLKGCNMRLEYPSVGATENIMMAATAAKGTTVIENCAREPEIRDLQDFINKCGGQIKGAGTQRIVVDGGGHLKGCSYSVMADRIEAGTYLIMALATDGAIELNGIEPEHLNSLTEILKSGGYNIKAGKHKLYAEGNGDEIIHTNISTEPYPGFPTDLQPQIAAMLTMKGRDCIIRENVFENRFNYAKQLIKMGADIDIFSKHAIIRNNNMLWGADVNAEDLRGGAALVIAGLMSEGETIVRNTKYTKRGYERFTMKIRNLGGEIREDGE